MEISKVYTAHRPVRAQARATGKTWLFTKELGSTVQPLRWRGNPPKEKKKKQLLVVLLNREFPRR